MHGDLIKNPIATRRLSEQHYTGPVKPTSQGQQRKKIKTNKKTNNKNREP